MDFPLLSKIKKPQDLRKFSDNELLCLADEIRQRIIQVTSKNGGHVGPNLGVVELTIALHLAFDSPTDKFCWDVSPKDMSTNYLREETTFRLIK